jgi:hypothetical protein
MQASLVFVTTLADTDAFSLLFRNLLNSVEKKSMQDSVDVIFVTDTPRAEMTNYII